MVILDEAGPPAADVEPPADPLFVLSDHHDFGSDDRQAVAEYDPRALSLGPVTLHADQAITVAHNWLDTDGFRRY